MSRTYRRIPFWIAREDKLDPRNATARGYDGGQSIRCVGEPFADAPKGFDRRTLYWGPLKKVMKRRTAHLMRARDRKIVRAEIDAFFLAREEDIEDLNKLMEADFNDYEPFFDDPDDLIESYFDDPDPIGDSCYDSDWDDDYAY